MKRMVEERVQQAWATGCIVHVVLCLGGSGVGRRFRELRAKH